MKPEVLEKYRVIRNLNCTELCALMGKTGGWYSRIRNGIQPLKSQYIPQLAEIFGILPEELASEYFSGEHLEDTAS